MISPSIFPLEGGCDCRHIRYRMETAPMFVHCCHCRWCQRESGAAFALNAMIEGDRVTVLAGQPEIVHTPSASGKGQQIARCPICRVAVWSNYSGAGPIIKFVRVGTLDQPDHLPPDIHIFTDSKQPWLTLAPGTPAVPAYYNREQYWPPASLARRAALVPLIKAYQASISGSGHDTAARAPVVVRPVRHDDFLAWKPLWDAYNAFYGRHGDTALPAAMTELAWQRFLDADEPMFALLAESDGEILGLAHYLFHRSTTQAEPVCYLQDLFTAPSARGRGVARSLIDGVVKQARAAGSSRVYWQTHASNSAARLLYDKVASHAGFIVYKHEL